MTANELRLMINELTRRIWSDNFTTESKIAQLTMVKAYADACLNDLNLKEKDKCRNQQSEE